jgi:sulfite dehydrogenase (quinone) subunit SoeB
MTALPRTTKKKLGLVIDLDTYVGCHACSVNCKEWNTSGHMAPLTDTQPFGVSPYGAREFDTDAGVMKKCTLCIDRIYNENLEEIDRVPACVATCPVNARHFGDLGDPASDVSKLVADGGGYDLMPELDYQPTYKYLPPRPRRNRTDGAAEAPALQTTPGTDQPFLSWINRVLSR